MKDHVRLVKNAASNLARGAAGAVVAILLPALLVRHMSQLSYGVWSLVLQIAAYVGYLDFGLQTAIGRYVAFANEKNDAETRDSVVSTAFAALCGACVLGALFIIIVASLANRLFPHVSTQMLPEIRWSLAIVGVSMALGLPASSWNGVFVGLQRNEVPAITVGGAKLLSAGAIAVIVVSGYSLVLMASAMAGVNLISYAVQYWLLRILEPDVKLRWNLVRRSTAKELGGYCFSLTIWSFSMMLVTGLDLVLVGRFEFKMVAAYAVASSLVTFVSGVQCAIFSAVMPQAAVIHAQGESEKLGRLLISTTRVGVVLLIISGIPLLMYCAPLFRIWVGPAYAREAQIVFPVLLLANMIRLVWVPYSVILIGTGQQRLVAINPLVEGLTNVFASLLLGFRFGAIGVAYGTLIGAVVASVANLVYSMPRTNKQMSLRLSEFLSGGIAVPSLVGLPLLALTQIGNSTLLIPATGVAFTSSVSLAVWVTLSGGSGSGQQMVEEESR